MSSNPRMSPAREPDPPSAHSVRRRAVERGVLSGLPYWLLGLVYVGKCLAPFVQTASYHVSTHRLLAVSAAALAMALGTLGLSLIVGRGRPLHGAVVLIAFGLNSLVALAAQPNIADRERVAFYNLVPDIAETLRDSLRASPTLPSASVIERGLRPHAVATFPRGPFDIGFTNIPVAIHVLEHQSGPLLEPRPGDRPGSIFVAVAPSRDTAWITIATLGRDGAVTILEWGPGEPTMLAARRLP